MRIFVFSCVCWKCTVTQSKSHTKRICLSVALALGVCLLPLLSRILSLSIEMKINILKDKNDRPYSMYFSMRLLHSSFQSPLIVRVCTFFCFIFLCLFFSDCLFVCLALRKFDVFISSLLKMNSKYLIHFQMCRRIVSLLFSWSSYFCFIFLQWPLFFHSSRSNANLFSLKT